MPERLRSPELSVVNEQTPVRRFELEKGQLAGYQAWKERVPEEVRALVEAHLLGNAARVDRDDLPSAVEFHLGLRRLLADPHGDVSLLGVSEIVQKQLRALQRVEVHEQQLNLFAALADPTVGFDIKTNYAETKLLPRLAFLRARDGRLAQKSAEAPTTVTGEEEEEEYTPHRSPEQEGEGLPDEAIATIDPFFGGYVLDSVYDAYDPATLTWKKSRRRFSPLPVQTLDRTRLRAYRSTTKNGKGAVKLPRRWGVDPESITGATVEQDQDGLVRLKVDGEDKEFRIDIAPSMEAVDLAPPQGDVERAQDRFPQELLDAAREVMGSQATFAKKVRRVASIIHKHLEYDKDPQWEAIYKADTSRYFEMIWQHKKAKCDEANTMLARLLTTLGVHARFAGGHSVRTKSPSGAALLLETNRHAWTYAWDPEEREWIRLDATPAGDPNVDQEEQQEALGEGDYGEQEVELMSQEELDKRMEELAREDEEREERLDPVLAYAREAGCTPEEAREALEKIGALRERYAKALADADRQWQNLVRHNERAHLVDRGPLPMSQMDEIDPDELVAGYIQVLAGERDPLIGMREATEVKKEEWFGGYEVYIAADMSESMNWTLGGDVKAKAQRDMVFLTVDSCMTAAVTAKKQAHKLVAPMPVKVSVVVLGEKTEIVLPLTDTWGPKEQIILYRALDAGAGGSTPDHKALKLIEEQIAVSLREQDAARAENLKLQEHKWKPRRFVVATADGGSDDTREVKRAVGRLTEMGVPVDLFLIAPEEDERLRESVDATYGSVTPITRPDELGEKALAKLTARIADAYKQKV